MTDKVQKILSEIATRKLCTMDEHMAFYNDKAKEDYRLLSDIEEFIKALQEEPVSQDLEEAAWLYYDKNRLPIPQEWDLRKEFIDFFKAGAQWQKEHLWKPTEWSEEDKAILEKCIGAVKVSCYSYSFKSEAENWLKSLRPQNRWKPTENQIKTLHDLNITGNISNVSQGQTLIELYNDLKKL